MSSAAGPPVPSSDRYGREERGAKEGGRGKAGMQVEMRKQKRDRGFNVYVRCMHPDRNLILFA